MNRESVKELVGDDEGGGCFLYAVVRPQVLGELDRHTFWHEADVFTPLYVDARCVF
jgi:hypothetical protein